MWNGEHARFTGWCDVPLTVKGRVEAVGAGQLLRSRGFRAAKVDAAFTSELQRAHETCELALASMAGHRQNTWSSDRIRRDARLNERHYGAVQGFYKNDMELRAKFGDDTIREWRRSMDAKPPRESPLPLLDAPAIEAAMAPPYTYRATYEHGDAASLFDGPTKDAIVESCAAGMWAFGYVRDGVAPGVPPAIALRA